MVHNCILTGCRFRKRSNRCLGVMYHSFPTDQPRLQHWETLIRQNSDQSSPSNTKLSKHSKLCQFHFQNSDYQVPFDPDHHPTELRRNKHLKTTAIPSIFGEEANKAADDWIARVNRKTSSEHSSTPPPSSCNEHKSKRLNTCIDRLRIGQVNNNHYPIIDYIFNSSIHRLMESAYFTLPRPTNEIVLQTMLSAFNLTRYHHVMIAIGADDLKQIAELNDSEKQKLLAEIGMEGRKYHVQRFEAMIEHFRTLANQQTHAAIVQQTAKNETVLWNAVKQACCEPKIGLKNGDDLWKSRDEHLRKIESKRDDLKHTLELLGHDLQNIELIEKLKVQDRELAKEHAHFRRLIRKHEGRLRAKQRKTELKRMAGETNEVEAKKIAFDSSNRSSSNLSSNENDETLSEEFGGGRKH